MERFGRYQLIRRVGAGGMAEVFEAKLEAGEGFEKTLAIKRILPHLTADTDLISMFRDEVRLMVRLAHPNIVQTFDFGRIGDSYFLAMEYVEGRDLRSILNRIKERNARTPLPLALHVAAEVLKGLEYAHDRTDPHGRPLGIVHRDVTPSNILVSYDGSVKLVDFGIAKTMNSRESQTKLGFIKGKASYLAPEQLEPGARIDGRVDIFSLGVLLWEMLCNRKLFSAENELGVINSILKAEILPPSKVEPTVPPDVDAAVLKALERDPARRYETAGEMAEDLTVLYRRHGGRVSQGHHGKYVRRLFPDEEPASPDSEPTTPLNGVSARDVGAPPIGADVKGAGSSRTRVSATAGPEPSPLPGEVPSERTRVAGAAMSGVESPVSGRRRLGKLAAGGLLVAVALVGWVSFRPGGTSTGTVAESTASSAPATGATLARTPVLPEPSHVAIATAQPVPTAATAVTRKRRPTPAPTVVARSTPAAIGHGTLNLSSSPWGDIFVDGRSLGRQTPAFGLKLEAGEHEIRIVNPIQKTEARFKVRVEAGQTVSRDVPLKTP